MFLTLKRKKVLLTILCLFSVCLITVGFSFISNSAKAEETSIVFVTDNNAKNEAIAIPKDSNNWYNTVVTTEDGFMNIKPKYNSNGYQTGLLVGKTDLSSFNVSDYPYFKIRMNRHVGTFNASDFDTSATWQGKPFINLELEKTDGKSAYWQISKLDVANDQWVEVIVDLSKKYNDGTSPVKYIIDGSTAEKSVKFDYSNGTLGDLESFSIKLFTYNQEDLKIEREATIEYFGFFKTYDDAKAYSVDKEERINEAKKALNGAKFSIEYVDGKTEKLAVQNAMSAISAVAGVGVKGINASYLISNDKEEGYVRFEKIELASGGKKIELNDFTVTINKPYDPVVWTYTQKEDLVGMEQWDLKTMEIKDNALHIVKKTPKEEDGFDFTVDMAEGNANSNKRASFEMEHYGFLKIMFKVVGQGRLQFYHFQTDNDANGNVTRQYNSNSRSFVVGWEEDTWLSVIIDFSKTYNAVTVQNMETGEIESHDVYGDNYAKNFTPVPFTGLSERFRFNFGRRNNLEREAYIKYIAFFPSMEQALSYESDKQAFEIDATINIQQTNFKADYEDANTLSKAIAVVKEQVINAVGVNANVNVNVNEYNEPKADRVGNLKFGVTVSYKGSEFTFNNLEMSISAERQIPTVAWFFNNEKVLDYVSVDTGGKISFNDNMLDFKTKSSSSFTLNKIEDKFFLENYKNLCLGIKSTEKGSINVVIKTDEGEFNLPASVEGGTFVKKCYANLEEVKGRIQSITIEGKSLQLSYIAFITGDSFDGRNFYSSELEGKLNSIQTSFAIKHYQGKTEDMAKQVLTEKLTAVVEEGIIIESIETIEYKKATLEQAGMLRAKVKFATDSVLLKGETDLTFTVNIEKIVNNDIIYDFSDEKTFSNVSALWNTEGEGNFTYDQENGQIVMKTKNTDDKNGLGFMFSIKDSNGKVTEADVNEYGFIKLGFSKEGFGQNSGDYSQGNYTGKTEIIFRRTGKDANNQHFEKNMMTCSFNINLYNYRGTYLIASLDLKNKTVTIFNPETNEVVGTALIDVSKTSAFDEFNGMFNQVYVTMTRNVSKEGAKTYQAPSATCKYFGLFNDVVDANAFRGEMSIKATAIDGSNLIKTEKVIKNATIVDALIKLNNKTLTEDGLLISYGNVQAYVTTDKKIVVKVNGNNVLSVSDADKLFANAFRHVALVEQNGKIKLYLDGVNIGEGVGSFSDTEILVGGITARSANLNGLCAYVRAWKNANIEDVFAYAYITDITAVKGLISGWRLLNDEFTQKGVVSDAGVINVINIYGRLGHEFVGEDSLETEKQLDTVRTVETWIRLNEKDKGNVMTVFSSSIANKLKLEILSDGNIKFSSGNLSIKTTDYDVFGKGWLMISIVLKDNSTELYINGELYKTFGEILLANGSNGNIVFGYDKTSSSNYMTGFIGETRFWSTVRTAEEILNNRDNYASGTEAGLERCYRFDSSKNLVYTDYSKNNADATIYSKGWFKTNMTGYEHSIVIIGDTQNHIMNDHVKNNIAIDWILENKESMNIDFVMHLGDFTQNCTDLEMMYAYESISALNEIIPFVVTMGNHDFPSLTNIGAELRDSTLFNKYLDYDYYKTLPNFGGTFEIGKMENIYMYFETGDIEWLILSVEYAPRDEVVEWADYVISQNPDKNVIIITHQGVAMIAENGKGEQVIVGPSSIYYDDAELKLSGEGMYLDASKTGLAQREDETVNEGLDVWNKLIKRHENIVQAVYGHSQAETQLRVETGDNGNEVNLIHHDASAMGGFPSHESIIAIMQFNDDGSACVYQYSPERDAYCKTDMFYNYNLQFQN